jgi:hypothetical protein
LRVGTNVFAPDANGVFVVGPLPLGTNEIAITATNALFGISARDASFQTSPFRIDVQADEEFNGVTSFELHTLTYMGVVTTPPTFKLSAFVLAGLPGERWNVDISMDLRTWINNSTYTLNETGLAEIRVPYDLHSVFMRATVVD